MDWSSEDPTSTSADSIYVTPAESDGGIYLDESYNALGRRRATLAQDEMVPREVHVAARMAGRPAPRLATHWGRDQAMHWNAPTYSPAGTDDKMYVRANRGKRERFEGAPQRIEEARVWPHLSDRESLGPIYAGDYDERPAGYKPASWEPWSRLKPMAMQPTEMPASASPQSPDYNGTPPTWAAPWAGGPSPVASVQPSDFTRGWGQNAPWAAGPPISCGAKESFAGSTMTPDLNDLNNQLQLLFLFIIIVILALILRSIERATGASYRAAVLTHPWSAID